MAIQRKHEIQTRGSSTLAFWSLLTGTPVETRRLGHSKSYLNSINFTPLQKTPLYTGKISFLSAVRFGWGFLHLTLIDASVEAECTNLI